MKYWLIALSLICTTALAAPLTATKVPVASGASGLIDGDLYDTGGKIGLGIASPSFPIHSVISKAYATDEVAANIVGVTTNSGSAAPGAGHGIGVLGWAKDNVNSKHAMIGTEGRGDSSSNQAILIEGINGDAIWTDPDAGNGTTFAGSVIGVLSQRYIYAHDGVTPRMQGTSYGFLIGDVTGGNVNYGILVQPQAGATVNVSEAIGTGTYQTLQVGYDADGTTAHTGIVFGLSSDTGMYRSAANTLTVSNELVVTGISSDGTGKAVCIKANGALGTCSTVVGATGLCTCG